MGELHKPFVPSECVKILIEGGLSSWQIRKKGVSPKRITKISRGESTGKRGRKAKFDEEHKYYVITLAKSDPRISNKEIRELFEQHFNQKVSAGKVSEWLHSGKIFYGKPIVIQDLTDYQIIARYNFALEINQSISQSRIS